MNTVTRRAFVGRTSLLAAVLCGAGCTVTTDGNITSLTLDVAAVQNYGQAGLNAVATILSIGAFASVIGAPAVAVIDAADVALSGALSAFEAAAGKSLTITYDTSSPSSVVDSVLGALQTVAGDLQAAVKTANASLSDSDLSKATTVLAAVETVVSLFKGLLGVVSVSAGRATMTEAQALRILGVYR